MRATIIYESFFGNTQAVAEAISEGLSGRFNVVVCEVGQAPPSLAGVDLLVLGGPIHAWSMSRDLTRKGAREQAEVAEIEPASQGIGIRDYLRELPEVPAGIAAAAFDTALRKTGWLPTGSAAKPAAKRLEARGFSLLVEPEHFYVKDTQGPLDEGELDRARVWGVALADAYVRASSRPMTDTE
jgi:hypothetical protein